MDTDEAVRNGRAKAPRDSGATEWYRRFRPRRLADVRGQPEAVAALKAMLRDGLPRALLLTGPSGVGKTTLARILAGKLNCNEDLDFFEVNCASLDEPLKTIRGIERAMHLSPRGGDCRVWYLDEAQSLSRAGYAQQALLKMLEDTPHWIYFMVATTDPPKLLSAIRTRCTHLALRSLTSEEIADTLKWVAGKAGFDLSEEVCDRLVECSGGSARQAVVDMQRVAGLPDDTTRLQALQPPQAQQKAFELVQMLLWRKPSWDRVRGFLATLEEDAEGMRRLILANARTELLKPKGQHERAACILDQFHEPFFDTPTAPAMLAWRCFEVLREAR